MDNRKSLRRSGSLDAFRWSDFAVFALSLFLLFAASASRATPTHPLARGYVVPVQFQGQAQGISYAVITFRLQGMRFFHYQEWGSDANPWAGDPASQADYARRLISFVGYPRFRGQFTREEIEIENIQFFVPPDASAQAAASACNLETAGYQVWSASGCSPPPPAAAQFSGRLEFSPISPSVNQDVAFSVSVESPADPYAYFTYRWYLDSQLVEDNRRVPGTPYSAAQLTRSFDTAGAHEVRVDVVHPSGVAITLAQSLEVAAPGALPSQPTESIPVSDRRIDWESYLPLLWPLLLLILLKPLWWLLRALLRLFGLIFSPFEQRAQAHPTKGIASNAGAVEEVPEEERVAKAEPKKAQPVGEQEEEKKEPPPSKKPAGTLHKPIKTLETKELQNALKSALDASLSMLFTGDRTSSPHAGIEKFRKHYNRRHIGPDFLEKYRDDIQRAAKESNLTPEMIGAAVLTEQRDLKKGEDLKDYGGSWAASSKMVTDLLAKEASIGLCQRQVGSLIELGVHHDLGLEEGLKLRWNLASALLDDKENLRIAGFFIRRLANQAADLAAAPQHFGEAVHDFCAEATRLADKEKALAARAADLSQTAKHVMSQPLDKLYEIDIQTFASQNTFGQIKGRWPEQALKTVDDAMALAEVAARLTSRYPDLAVKAQIMRDAAHLYKGLIGSPMQGFVNGNLGGHPLDFSVFKQPSINWTPAHVEFIGWKYNTGHLGDMDSITGIRDWGHNFLMSYLDIVKAAIFKGSGRP